MKPPRAHPRIQQLNLTLAEPSPAELPNTPKNELEAAAVEAVKRGRGVPHDRDAIGDDNLPLEFGSAD